MYYAHKFDLQPADRIVEPIFQTGISKHHALYLGFDRQGREWIAENQKFAGVRMLPADDFFAKEGSYTIERFSGNREQRLAVVKRAIQRLGEPYRLIDFNCEHYAEFALTGKSVSRQVQKAVIIVIVLICMLLIIQNSKK